MTSASKAWAWLKSITLKPVDPAYLQKRRIWGGPNRRALAVWIEQHMPELDAELTPLKINKVRIRLNEITGCAVLASRPVEDGCAVFLAALQKMKEAE